MYIERNACVLCSLTWCSDRQRSPLPLPLAMAAEAATAGGGVMLSGPGQACLDALRCAAFLGQQHPQDLKEALLHTLASSSSRTTTAGGGAEAGWLSWLSSLVSAVQGVMGEAGTRRRRRRKKRRKRDGAGQAGEEQEAEETASEEEEEEEEEELEETEASGAASGGSIIQRPEQSNSMEVEPAAPVSAPVRPRADLVSSRSGRRGGAVRRTAVVEALASGDVVGSIFSFLVGVGEASTGRQSVRQLGQLGLVCRKWREVSSWEAWWVGAAEEMLPVSVWGRGEGGGAGVGGRGRVVEHGRMLMYERRVWFGDWGWARRLSLMFEVFDRMDGLQMLSVRGPLKADMPLNETKVWLHIGRGPRWEVVGQPFSAASRDPEQRRFQSMRDFFKRGHQPAFASSVCVRVSVVDERTGRRALLWEEEGKQTSRMVDDMPYVHEPLVPGESFAVRLAEAQLLMCPAYSGPQLRGRVTFYVSPVAGQPEGVSEQERLYQLAGGDEENYEQHESLIGLTVSDGDFHDMDKPPADIGAVGRFVRSVLGMGQV